MIVNLDRYYINLVKKQEYSVDHQALKEYFPLETVTKGMMKIYERLLGLTIFKIEGAKVQVYRIHIWDHTYSGLA